MKLDPEYIKYLEQEIKHLDKELISILELPDVDKFRQRIKKDRRETQGVINLFARITKTNEAIRQAKVDISSCLVEAKLQLKRNIKGKQAMCIVCRKEKPVSEMDENNICEHCRTMGMERY